ncbi:condensation domain-containing protein [Micromonospora sp. CPCC 206060]|uniref:condensation domain-containing protein n=1 Tax=Micromonospora sp. CPCC 206060 TaxID=3122406 RepID=UPI002FF24830
MRFADAAVPAEWAAETLVYAEFQGEPAGTAPLTWAQQVMWRAAARSGSNHAFLNLRRTVAVSERVPADLTGVTRAVGILLGRHGALRTRVRPVDGEPHQETAVAGRLPLLVVPADADDAGAAQAVAERLAAVAFDHAEEWPLRVALVLAGDRVRQIVVVFSHSTVDAHAAEVVLRDLRLILLRGAPTTPPGPQSVDVARLQHGADRRRSERAADYWLREYRRLPAQPLTPVGPGLTPHLHRGVLVSSAVDLAARLIAARQRVSVSAVLLAGMTASAVARSDREVCGLFPMAHNRFRGGYANAVANLGQIGFCVVDLADRPGFAAVVDRVWQASLDGLRHAYYDPVALRRKFEDEGYDYGTAFLPHYYFNDVRLAVGGADPIPDVTERDLRAAMTRSQFSWTAPLRQASWHLLTHLVDEPGGVGVTLTVDTRYIPVESVEPILRGLEELLVDAALRDVPWPWSTTDRIPS